MAMTEIARPINYYGSKERMACQIIDQIRWHTKVWVDVFCGSGIVTLKKPPHPKEFLNDLDCDVVNLFEVLRSGDSERLIQLVELTPYSEQILQNLRNTAPSDDPVERAWQFLCLKWFGRGGDAHATGFRWSRQQCTGPEKTFAGGCQTVCRWSLSGSSK